MWLARVLVKSDMKIKLLSTNFLPVLWYIVFGFSKCLLEIVLGHTTVVLWDDISSVAFLR